MFSAGQGMSVAQLDYLNIQRTEKYLTEMCSVRIGQILPVLCVFFDFGHFLVFWTHSKVVQKGHKGTKMVNPSVVDNLEPFWTISDKKN